MAKDEHVPQNQVSDEARAAFLARIHEIGREEWTSLLARALTVRQEWDHSSAELEESDVEPGPNDGPWNSWHLLNHVGGFTGVVAGHLRAMATGETRELAPRESWQGDDKTFLEVRSGAIAGWDALVAAITEATISPPDAGSVTHPAFGALSARDLAAMTLLHAQDHARQLREIRGLDAHENPGDSAGDLGRRRQTAH